MGEGAQSLDSAASYKRRILAAYEGEVVGQAFFLEMSRHSEHDIYGKRVFAVLAEVERQTGLLMRGVLERYCINCPLSDELVAKGIAIARIFEELAWDAAIVEMAKRITPAVVRFESLLRDAPACDRADISLLLEHEWALERFMHCKPRRSKDALASCVNYLRCLRERTSH